MSAKRWRTNVERPAHRKCRFLPPPYNAKKHIFPSQKKYWIISRNPPMLFADLETSLLHNNGHEGQPSQPRPLDCLMGNLVAEVFSESACRHTCACVGRGGGTESTGGHVWGTCCGNRYMCGFIKGEVKAGVCSCSCLEGLISVNNTREEVKSRNCPCATQLLER